MSLYSIHLYSSHDDSTWPIVSFDGPHFLRFVLVSACITCCMYFHICSVPSCAAIIRASVAAWTLPSLNHIHEPLLFKPGSSTVVLWTPCMVFFPSASFSFSFCLPHLCVLCMLRHHHFQALVRHIFVEWIYMLTLDWWSYLDFLFSCGVTPLVTMDLPTFEVCH